MTAAREAARKAVALDWIAAIKERPACPKCEPPQTLVGPFYDRAAMRCLNCGHTWRAEP